MMTYFFILALVLFAYMNGWFFISLVKKRNDVADVAWGLGFLLLAWTSFLLIEKMTLRGILVTLLVSVWGLRLSWHINARHQGKPEDYRYALWRAQWGKWFYVRSYLQIYVLQGFLLFIVALPIMFIHNGGVEYWGIFDALGVLLWLIGFYFEVVSDRQLAIFLKNPANQGKLMTQGLWAYSRHPNYFGEVTQWWGIWLMGLSVPFGWLGIIGPITITFLILKVSGVPMLEKKMIQNPEFAEYRRRVSIFIPMPNKK